jgi:tRNA pseudouridine65 synthase
MPFPISVLSETSEYLIVDKPSGLSVHPDGSKNPSVLDLLGKGLHLAHRLDKETSGILLIAKSSSTAARLMEALSSNKSEKFYRAILRGPLALPDPIRKVHWTWPISDKGEGRQSPQGKGSERLQAETVVEVIKTNRFFSDIRAQILTGRQHQIRKHAALAKHPVVGDARYNDLKYNQSMFALYSFERMLLHAEHLDFIYQEKRITVDAPLPEEFDLIMKSND